MIYSHKPQRGGRSIQANTNNPPQDPPPPHETVIPETVIPETVIPDVLISDSTPPVMDAEPPVEIINEPQITHKEIPKVILPEKPIPAPRIETITPQPIPKIKPTLRMRIISFIKKLFRRK